MTSAGEGRRILITGAEGFIGRHLAQRLLSLGYSPVGYDIVHGDDVLDERRLAQVAADITGIVHLAGPSSVLHFREAPEESWRATLVGLRNVLRVAKGRVVFPSTGSLYGSSQERVRESDTLPPPSSLYVSAKLECERLCALHALHGGACKIVRVFTAYGPGEWRKGRYASVVTHVARAVVSGDEAAAFGDGTQTRDLVFAGDVADALVRALETTSREMIFNVGTGHPTSFNQLLGALERHTRCSARVAHLPPPVGYATSLVANPELASRELGFVASTSLGQGLRLLIDNLSLRIGNPPRIGEPTALRQARERNQTINADCTAQDS